VKALVVTMLGHQPQARHRPSNERHRHQEHQGAEPYSQHPYHDGISAPFPSWGHYMTFGLKWT